MNPGDGALTAPPVQVIETPPPRVAALAREVLTWIERQEAEAVRFGIFAATTRGREVVGCYTGRTFEGQPCAEAEVLHALRLLGEAQQLVLLATADDAPGDPGGWAFRSRTGELVRLLAALRQRFARQLIPDAPSLVGDLIWDVRARRYPRRDIPLDAYLAGLEPRNRVHVRDALARLFQRSGRGATRSADLDDEDEAPGANFSGFQLRAMRLITDTLTEGDRGPDAARGVVIEAGTGSGKTYSFFLPLLGYLTETRLRAGLPGCKVLCVYPRQPLAENQFGAMVDVLFHLNRESDGERTRPRPFERQVRVGILYQRAPRSYRQTRDFGYAEWEAGPAPGSYVAPFVKCPACGGQLLARPGAAGDDGRRLVCAAHLAGESPPTPADLAFIRYAREDDPDGPPDILVAVTESLNIALTSTDRRALFGHGTAARPVCIPQVVMLDEIHLQTGSKGMQIGYLLRRILARLRENRAARQADTPGFGHPGQPPRPIVVAGLSATVHDGADFFSRLTGLPRRDVARVAPDAAAGELVEGDAEHLLFLKAASGSGAAALSTLIQTTMLLVHGYPQPPAGEPPYRTFGFADSLDLVNRWWHDQRDTEAPAHRDRTPLYRLRLPGERRNLAAFAPLPALACDVCTGRGYPEPACVAHRTGECWWPVYRGGLDRRVVIDRTTSQTQSFTHDADLVVATSKLEVGYDDDRLMVVVQYLAPRDLASFIQRKGRGGRQLGTRPLMATILSPSRPTDVFYFRNPHLLTDPTFRRLPLNPANALARQIHGIYGFLDWAANRADRPLSLTRLDAAWAELRRLSGSEEALDDYRRHLAVIFGADPGDPGVLATLVDDEHGLYQAILPALDRAVRARATPVGAGAGPDRQAERLSRLLPAWVPPNLFSDIHLPLVQVRSVEDREYDPGLDIDRALTEFVPGRVSYRYRRYAWVPVTDLRPASGARPAALAVAGAFSPAGQPWGDTFDLTWREVPRRFRRRLGAGERQGTIAVKRPYAIVVENLYPQAPDSRGRGWDDERQPRWGVDRDAGEAQAGARPALDPRSNAFPLRFTRLQLPPQGALPASAQLDRARGAGRRVLARDVGRFFDGVSFAVSADGVGVAVERAIIGTEYGLQAAGRPDLLSGAAAFTDADGGWVGLGFRGTSDGLSFALRRGWHGAGRFHPTAGRERHLLDAIFHYEAQQRVLERDRVNPFALGRLLEIALAYLGSAPGGRAERADAFARGDAEARAACEALLDGLYQRPRRRVRDDVLAAFERPAARAAIAETFRDTFVAPAEALVLQYREDILRHTLKHALKAAVRLLSGAADQGEIAGHTALHLDYAPGADGEESPITIFEVGLQGVGMVRALYEDMRRDPLPFFHVLGDLVERCDTAREEAWLLDLLARDPGELAALAGACRAAVEAIGVAERQQQLRAARAALARLTGRPAEEWMQRAAFRVLAAQLLLPQRDGTIATLPEWELYREINLGFLLAEEERLARPLGPREARFGLRRAVAGEPGRFPALHRLFRALAANDGIVAPDDEAEDDFDPAGDGLDAAGDLGAAERRFEQFVERRFLSSCRTACPSCLQDQDCDIDRSPLGARLLDRHLLVELLEFARAEEVVGVPDDPTAGDLARRLRDRFERDPHGVARLRAPATATAALDRALAELLARGVEIGLRPRRIGLAGDRPRADGGCEILVELV